MGMDMCWNHMIALDPLQNYMCVIDLTVNMSINKSEWINQSNWIFLDWWNHINQGMASCWRQAFFTFKNLINTEKSSAEEQMTQQKLYKFTRKLGPIFKLYSFPYWERRKPVSDVFNRIRWIHHIHLLILNEKSFRFA